jgi:glycosyltransferase involved in cell wall biosynthesis
VGANVSTLTPFNYTNIISFPVFALRRLIDPLNGEWSVWWYRYWHYYFLRKKLMNELKKLNRKGISTVIYAQCPLSALAALQHKRKGQKIFMVVHFNISQADEWVGKGKIKQEGKLYTSIKKQEKTIISQLDGIVYVSNFMKQILETNIPSVRSVKAICLPCFTNRPKYDASNELQGDLINIGTLESRKNQAYFFYVLAKCKEKGYTYSLTLIGDGPDKEKLVTLSRQFGLEKQITFLGFQHNASRFLKNHKVYVHSALIENLPIALLEALAGNLPILAAPTGGISEIVSDGIEGFHWPLEDAEIGAELLISLMENKELYSKVARATEKKYISHFATEKVSQQLLSFFAN